MAERKIVESGPWQGFEVISEYPDAQALEDGVLVNVEGIVPGGRSQRATRTVWADLVRTIGGVMSDVTLLVRIWERASIAREDQDWRILEDPQLGKFWLIPNDVGGRTLMRPEDY